LLFSLPSEHALAQYEDRYSFKYPRDFFNTGGAEVEYNPSVHKKIGILFINRTNLSLPEIANMVFNTSPFDRYKHFFTFALKRNFGKILQTTIFFPQGHMIIAVGQ
jgi:hypothetical protein